MLDIALWNCLAGSNYHNDKKDVFLFLMDIVSPYVKDIDLLCLSRQTLRYSHFWELMRRFDSTVDRKHRRAVYNFGNGRRRKICYPLHCPG